MLKELMDFISYIAIVSIAAERFTEIFKRIFVTENYKIKETYKPVIYQALAAVFGSVVYIVDPYPVFFMKNVSVAVLSIVVGLCVSGGSGTWNTILKILSDYSKSKQNPS